MAVLTVKGFSSAGSAVAIQHTTAAPCTTRNAVNPIASSPHQINDMTKRPKEGSIDDKLSAQLISFYGIKNAVARCADPLAVLV